MFYCAIILRARTATRTLPTSSGTISCSLSIDWAAARSLRSRNRSQYSKKSQYPKNMDSQLGIADLLRLGTK